MIGESLPYQSKGEKCMETARINSRLKELREQNHMSQSQLAAASGVNLRVLQDYEQGRKKLVNAKAGMVLQLSHALGCSVEVLVEYVECDELKLNQARRITCYRNMLNPVEYIGSVDVFIDEITPCLIDVESDAIVETVVFKIESPSYLKGFTKKNGWGIKWADLPEDVEVYALATMKDNQIQGLIGLRKDQEAGAVYIQWACTAPHNNIHENGVQRYRGVGGHLFAVAVEKSIDWGFDGAIYGFAANRELLKMYEERFGAQHLGMLHVYHFLIEEEAAKELLEVYRYEWNK